MIARLDIKLSEVQPLVQRRVEVPLAVRLDKLHTIFQAIMGWENAHLYAFWRGDVYQSTAYIPPDSPDETLDGDFLLATEITLAEYMAQIPTRTFVYTYDFGDDWHHAVRVAVTDRKITATYPRLVSAVGRCPPEDIGGPSGYDGYLEAHEVDPKEVDIAALQDRLSRLFPFSL